MTEPTTETTERIVKVTNVYTRNRRATKPVVANIGGADSSKSYSMAQLFIEKFKSEKNKTFLVCRKTLPALRLTAYRLVVDLLKDYGIYRSRDHNKSMNTISEPWLSNLIVFASVDDPEKYKSQEYNYIWIEEANEFTWEDFIILKLRLRAKTIDESPNRMYLTFNPSDELGWINQKLFKEPDVEKIHSTYKDNPFAADVDVGVLEGLRGQDESYWNIYARGEFARLKGKIHTLVMSTEPYPECRETIYGLDFGFVNPNVLLQIDIDFERMTLYITELIHKSGQTNSQLIADMKDEIPEEHRGREIYADSAEPARIEEISDAGFNIFPAEKSVLDGIDCVNRFKLVTNEENVKANPELNGYKRKVDRKGDVLEEPVKFKDHSPNALRYAVYTHLRDRLLPAVPGFTITQGSIKAEEKAREEEAVRAPVSDEREEPKVVISSKADKSPQEEKPQKKAEEKEGPRLRKRPPTPGGHYRKQTEKEKEQERKDKEPREDEDWVV